MMNVTLQALLEAGCHFGHKAERWHPKANEYIYTKKDGIHIIDLAKTKAGLTQAMEFIRSTVAEGGEVLFVGTKRQARIIVKEEAKAVGAPFFAARWIGGFLTNWEAIKKNIDKVNRMTDEKANGAWKRFPKHEQVKLGRELERLNTYYEGVLTLKKVPQALFIIDVKKEIAAVREGQRCELPVLAVVDTNSDPSGINYVIPANDDAVGSIRLLMQAVASAYSEGKEIRQKEVAAQTAEQEKARAKQAAEQEAAKAKAAADQAAAKAKAAAAIPSDPVVPIPAKKEAVKEVTPVEKKPAAVKEKAAKKKAVEKKA